MKSEVFNQDCMEGMKQFPDNYFDLAVVDPPYTDEFRVVNSEECAKLGNYKTESLNNNAPTDEYFKEVIRISKNQIIWGVNYYKFYLGVGRIVWDKDNTGNYSDCELAYHSFGNVVRKFTFRWNGMLQQDMKNKEVRIHPTQKPVALYSWIYHNYLPNGGKVLDTHLGSGSNRIAAHKAGNIDFTAYELDKDYFEAQEKRYKQFISQQVIEFPD